MPYPHSLQETERRLRLHGSRGDLKDLLKYARSRKLGAEPNLSQVAGQAYIESIMQLYLRRFHRSGKTDDQLSLLMLNEWQLQRQVVSYSYLQVVSMLLTRVGEVPLEVLRRFPAPAVLFDFPLGIPDEAPWELGGGVMVSVIPLSGGRVTLAASIMHPKRSITNWMTFHPGDTWQDANRRNTAISRAYQELLMAHEEALEDGYAPRMPTPPEECGFNYASKTAPSVLHLALNCALYLVRYAQDATPPVQTYAGLKKQTEPAPGPLKFADLGRDFDQRLRTEEIDELDVIAVMERYAEKRKPGEEREERPYWRQDAQGQWHWVSYQLG